MTATDSSDVYAFIRSCKELQENTDGRDGHGEVPSGSTPECKCQRARQAWQNRAHGVGWDSLLGAPGCS